MKATNNTMNVFKTKRAIYSVLKNEEGTLTIIREYILNNGFWHKDGCAYKNAGLLIVQNGGIEALLSKCKAVDCIEEYVKTMNRERKESARWAAEDDTRAKEAFEAAFSEEVTEATPENISTLLRYLNTVNWGVWELPKMTVGYVCHQYDCDGKTATTIKLDTPVMFFEKLETMFVYGNPRGHLADYTKIG